MSSLPMYFPSGYEKPDALTCAKFIACGYDQYAQWTHQGCPNAESFVWTPSVDPTANFYSKPLYWTYTEWDWDKYVTYQEPIGFVVMRPNYDAFLVFRGTQSDEDWYMDGQFNQTPYALATGYGQVHEGFFAIYQQLSPLLRVALLAMNKHHPIKRFLFAGHSLGSGLSSLAVPDILANTAIQPSTIPMAHYNFASPRVGDQTYASAMNESGVPTFRVVNTEDIVPDSPTAISGPSTYYQHIGTPVDFTANYESIADNHSMVVSYQYALDHPNHPFGPLPQRPAGFVRRNPDLEFLHRDPRAAPPQPVAP